MHFAANFVIMERRAGGSTAVMTDRIHRDKTPRSMSPSTSLGDLAWRRPEESSAIINSALQGYVNNRNGLTPNVDLDSEMFLRQITDFKRTIGLRVQNEASPIQDTYRQADIKAIGKSTQEHLNLRLGKKKLNLVLDSDGTLTTNDRDYLKISPGNGVGDRLLDALGRDKFYDVFASTWRMPLQMYPSLFYTVGKERAKLRPGVTEFIKVANEKVIPLTILSANFEPLVQGILDQIEGSETASLLAVTPDSILSTEKGACLNQLALNNPDNAVIFIGDGSSDIPAIEARENIGWFFAPEGSKFAQELERQKVRHHSTFTDFYNIISQLNLVKNPAVQLSAK